VIPAIERQKHFLELAATHAEDFKTRVAQHDRENTFPFENVEAMKASGYTNMTVPEELGGGALMFWTWSSPRSGWPRGMDRLRLLSICTLGSWGGWLTSGA
jgi:alkylation response protein AidB-like acyl-CoA dehydrogenase